MKTLLAVAATLLCLPALAADSASAPAAPRARAVEIDCQSTASRIHRRKIEECGRSTQPTTNHYADDLQRTGETDLGKALQKLDPRIH